MVYYQAILLPQKYPEHVSEDIGKTRECVFKPQNFATNMSSKRESKTKKRAAKRGARAKTRTHTQPKAHTLHHPEHRERFYRAKRALRALKHAVLIPKAVIHTHSAHIPEKLLQEVPEQALIEHWEALGELKSKGIEIRPTSARTAKPHMLREVELDAPVSWHARHFASKHGLVIRERKHPFRSALERMFG